MTTDSALVCSWDDLPREQMEIGIGRKFFHSDGLMVAQITIPKGKIVPPHRHDNQQLTYMISGVMRFLFGEAQDEAVVLKPGQVVFIPGGLLHSAEAIEDVFELDVFNPPREDWITGSDAYLRQPESGAVEAMAAATATTAVADR